MSSDELKWFKKAKTASNRSKNTDAEVYYGIEELDADDFFNKTTTTTATTTTTTTTTTTATTTAKKTKKKKKQQQQQQKQKKKEEKKRKVEDRDDDDDDDEAAPSPSPSLASVVAWQAFGLHETILRSLAAQGFDTPTPVQTACLPLALVAGKDLAVAAPTGSGKTLAFALPILQHVLDARDRGEPSALRALVLTPTRELALQIVSHMRAASAAAARDAAPRVVAIVGGLAVQKQRRLLSARAQPDVIVATPGRLWELLSEINAATGAVGGVLATALRAAADDDADDADKAAADDQLRFLVLDEADRLVDRGHFAEIERILARVEAAAGARRRQTFVFSATLTEHVQTALNAHRAPRQATPPTSSVARLLDAVRFHRPRAVVDLTTQQLTASALRETRLMCHNDEKDAHLLAMHASAPTRTLVFVNAVDAARRVAAVLSLLRIPTRALHASLDQKRRLAALEFLRREPRGVLVATDVAARGLDVPDIGRVVHYHAPRTVELYVHRSGRTARASATGESVLLVSPQDHIEYEKLRRMLGRGGDQAAATWPTRAVDAAALAVARPRAAAARRFVDEQRRVDRAAGLYSNTENSRAMRAFVAEHGAGDAPLDDDEVAAAAAAAVTTTTTTTKRGDDDVADAEAAAERAIERRRATAAAKQSLRDAKRALTAVLDAPSSTAATHQKGLVSIGVDDDALALSAEVAAAYRSRTAAAARAQLLASQRQRGAKRVKFSRKNMLKSVQKKAKKTKKKKKR